MPNNSTPPLILVSNDDGITAPGIRFLVEQMMTLGNIVVVAPNKPQSGMSHAITLNNPLRIFKSRVFENYANVKAYETTGTPADCVKIAKNHILQGQKPDLVVSGVNHGDNSSINALYSGTLAAAIEGAMETYAIGFSVCDYGWDIDFDYTKQYILSIAKKVLKHGLPPQVALNVNIPKQGQEGIKGIKVCHQAEAKWVEKFDERTDPYGKKYLWLTGEFQNHDQSQNNDVKNLADNYVSIVPLKYDLTDYKTMTFLEEIF